MFREFIQTFFLIFIAELGDKTQIMLMSLAAMYSVTQILSGIFLGVAINHGLAILIGSCISCMMVSDTIHIFIGIIFILFGLLSFLEEDEKSKKRKTIKGNPVFTVALTYFLGELGDKTQLTCMTMSMDADYPYMVLLGSVSGMIAIGCVGIIIGTALTKYIPSYIIKIISGLIFILFGFIKLDAVENVVMDNYIFQSILITTIAFMSLALISKIITNR